MRILLAGATGMLGRDLTDVLTEHEVVGHGSAGLDVRDADACLAAAEGVDVVINASAYTAVDDAESHEDEAYAINAEGAANLAAAASAAGARLVQVSTDYVFAGDATTPYPEDAPLDPRSAYGRTKAQGERLALEGCAETIIVRTAWMYGTYDAKFPATMLRLARERDTLTVVDDQRGQPTFAKDAASQIVRLLDAGVREGTFHATNAGETTWFGFAQAIFEHAGLDPARIRPTDSASYVRPAPRPAFSVLGHEGWGRAGLTPMRPWQEALEEAFQTGVLKP